MKSNQRSERLKQACRTGIIRPKVRIISMQDDPIGTIFAVWNDSRHQYTTDAHAIEQLYSLKDIADLNSDQESLCNQVISDYPDYAKGSNILDQAKNVIISIVTKCIESDVPASQSVLFNIGIDDANVAWREQLVRSQVAQYWTQSTRTIDMTTMDVNMADSIPLIGGPDAVKIYTDTVEVIREAYRKLVDLGVPMEDIRLQPQQHVHRVTWMISLRALIKILNKRSDWIAQASLWTPVISELIGLLRNMPIFDAIKPFLGHPPVGLQFDGVSRKYKVSNYIMNADNEDRYEGRDKLPCDPLWLAYKGIPMPPHTDLDFYDYMKSMYIKIWSDEYLAVLGWDRNDPTKLGPYDRPVSN